MAKISTNEAVYDARQLGKGRMLVLGFQHMFAMFGATILVPTITGLSVSATLLFAGLGTLLFHWFTKMKVPAFLGSSFAFLGGYATVVAMGEGLGMTQAQALPYACVGVAAAGLLYFVLAACVKAFGVHRVMKLFPPVVTGPIIIAIGLILAGSAINNILTNWWVAIIAILVVVVCNIWGKGMIKIIPILLGVLVSYVVAAIFGQLEPTKVQALHEAAWVGAPFQWNDTGLYGQLEFPANCRHCHHAHSFGHHDRACRRHIGHRLHHPSQLYRRPRPTPYPHGRWCCHHIGFALWGTGQHHLR